MNAKRQKKFRIFLFSKRSHAGGVTAAREQPTPPAPSPTTFVTNPEKTNKSKEHPPTPYLHTPTPLGAKLQLTRSEAVKFHGTFAKFNIISMLRDFSQSSAPISTRSTPHTTRRRSMNFHKNPLTHSNNIYAPKKE